MKLSLATTSFLVLVTTPSLVEGTGLRHRLLAESPTLAAIEARGKLLCGSSSSLGMTWFHDDGTVDGLQVDLCHAIAAAIFGHSYSEHYEIVETNSANRFADLDSGAFDVLISTTTHTLSRDVELGLTFSVPYYYDGMRFAGPKGDCADMLDWTSEACSDLRVCVSAPTTHYPITQSLLPEENIVAVQEGHTAFYSKLNTGECNAIASEGTAILLSTALANGYTGANAMVAEAVEEIMDAVKDMPAVVNKASGPMWHVGTKILSKEPLAMASKQDDPIFADFVNWILQALLAAEERGITSADIPDLEEEHEEEAGGAEEHGEADEDHEEPELPLTVFSGFGHDHDIMFNIAVKTVGNFGEMWEKNLGDKLPRAGLNSLNTEGTPLNYPFPGV